MVVNQCQVSHGILQLSTFGTLVFDSSVNVCVFVIFGLFWLLLKKH